MRFLTLVLAFFLAFIIAGTENIVLAQQQHISYYSGQVTPEDSSKNYFEEAYKEIEDMLEGKDSLNYERAVFLTENAYWDNKIDYLDFQSILNFHTEHIKLIAEGIREVNQDKYKSLRIFDKKNFDPLVANEAIFYYMTSGIVIPINNQFLIRTPLRYSKYDPYGTEDWTNSQVFSLVNPYRSEGNCYAWTALFKIFSERLKSEAYISTAPNHVYIQHKDIRGGFYNVELPTRTFPGDGTIETLTYTTREGIMSGIAMRKLNLKESIGLCLIYLAKGYEYKFGEYNANFALRCSNLVLKHDSLNLNAMLLRASVMEESLIKYMTRKNIEDLNQLRKIREIKDLFSRYEKWINQLNKLGYREIPSDVQDILLARAKGETITTYKDRTPDAFPNLDVKDVRYITLSNGLFDEVHINQKNMKYGRTVLDTEKGIISKIINEDSLKEYKVDPVVFALNVDPLYKKYPPISPYAFCLDNPIIFKDVDGRLVLDLDGNPVTFTDGKVVGNLDTRTRSFLEALAKTPKGTLALQKAIDVKQQVKFVFNENDNPGERGVTNLYSKDGKKLTHKEKVDFENADNYYVVNINTGKNNDMMDSYSTEQKYNVIGTHEIVGHVGTDGRVHDEAHTDQLESNSIFESTSMEAHLETAIQYSVLNNVPLSSSVVNKALINFTYKGDDLQQKINNFNTHLTNVVGNLVNNNLITKEKGDEVVKQGTTAASNLVEKKK